MDGNRRTLSTDGPIGNALARTSLQPPASTVKLGLPRPSIAPYFQASQASLHGTQYKGTAQSAQHTSVPAAGIEPTMLTAGTLPVARRSTILSHRGAEQRESLATGMRAEGAQFGRTPQTIRSLPSRRSSVYPAGSLSRPSVAPGLYLPSALKDTRPVRDKGFQSTCIGNISVYLGLVRYPSQLTPKTLVSPTAKEFQSIFRFLINDIIDVGMEWGKRFEDDAITVLRDLRYPSMDSVTKTAIGAPGSPQAWPGLLAMLNWLVELCKAHENWHDDSCVSDPILMPYESLSPDYPNLEDRLLWNFSYKTYHQWFNGSSEDFVEAEQELEAIYGRMLIATGAQCDRLDTEVQKRRVELQQILTQEPPLKKLENDYVQLMGDKTKFIAFIDLHKQKADKTRQAIAKIRGGITNQEHELNALRTEVTQIANAVAAQNMSPDEVNRMNHERESLLRQLDEVRGKIAEASQSAYDQELSVTRSMDRFENLSTEYSSLRHQIGLMQAASDDWSENGIDSDYQLDLDLGVEDVETLKLAGVRMRTSVWQKLQLRQETYRQQASTQNEESIMLEDKHDRLVQQVERQKEEVLNLEVKLRMVHEQAVAAQTKFAEENATTNKIIVQLETEVTNMLAASQQGVLATQTQLESSRIAFKELQHKTSMLHDCLIAHVGGHIDAIIKAKEHAANSLRGIRSLAETQ
ncbi:hypothetical protein IAU60_001401 [Kwoniella sp. DSM 27419]